MLDITTYDPNVNVDPNSDPGSFTSLFNTSGVGGNSPSTPSSLPVWTSDPAYQAMIAGNEPTVSPVQNNTTGANLFGWLGLGNAIAQTVIGATKAGTPVYPKPRTTLATPASSSSTLLLAAAAILLLVLFMGRK